MERQIATNQNQSASLLQCGVSADTADMMREQSHRYGSHPTPIIQFDENGNFIARHNGIREAERATGITHGAIARCCKGRTAKVRGYIFLYEHDASDVVNRKSPSTSVAPMLIQGEVWSDIIGYEGLYQVSNMGRVRSCKRIVTCGFGTKIMESQIISTQILSRHKDSYKQCYVSLSKDGEGKKFIVARLVAKAFIPNPHNLPQVNHKDEDPTNNHVDNLEWCTCAYNLTYNNGCARRAETRRKSYKRVLQIDGNGSVVKEWESAIAAARGMGCALASISRAINGHRKHVRGYKFVWKDEWLTANGYKLNEQ